MGRRMENEQTNGTRGKCRRRRGLERERTSLAESRLAIDTDCSIIGASGPCWPGLTVCCRRVKESNQSGFRNAAGLSSSRSEYIVADRIIPELPEVETFARGLDERLIGRTVTGVGRRGNWIVIQLDSEDTLLAHLRMTGELLLEPAGSADGDYTRVISDC
jgi:hypothetical protein